ncbi:putative dienelactone hydrolase [Allocatelliglobosispora scoriae]|uniref:Putative dienelactone hydrolase n=1 Tax=Allocatelliglobosispora scoriae TaxID=643052 RepID=A0A841C3I3_9ACTN|nr:alpha/beta hydrolase [Allocatelliglobosispora scoriae]MBB5873391.1 putative dienelactone hydrolase [Allocatelliglobosispora scoriae]
MLRRAILALTLLTAGALVGLQAPAAAADSTNPGPYAVGYVDANVSASGRSFSARVYYPATTAGQNAPIAAGRFPAVAFGHGFLQAISKYAGTLTHLSSWGFVVAAPTSQGGLFPSHGAFADDLNAQLAWLVAQDATAGSRFNAHINTAKLGLSGHSMGAGASVLAGARNSAVTTVANLAAAETNPSAVTAAGTLTKPLMLLSGSADGTAPPASHQRPIYNAKPAPKQLRTITGGFHCGFMDSTSTFCDSGSISRATQLQITRRVLTDWFRFYLAGDTSLNDAVWGTAAHSDPQVVFEGVA